MTAFGFLKRLITHAPLLFLLALPASATDFWTGAGGNDNWSTGGNWQDGSAPANPDSTALYFTQADAGNTSVVDRDWSVRYMVYSNQSARHTLDLGGNKLVVHSQLMAGRDTTNCWITMQNGTLQLGTGAFVCVVYVGYRTSGSSMTNNSLTVNCALAVSNAGNIQVGYGTPTTPTVSGLWDLSGATISTRGVPNVLIVSNVHISFRSTSPSALKLPPSLAVFEVNGALNLGNYGFFPAPCGTLDFGENSSLTNLRVRGDFLMGENSASGILTNLPAGVHLEVGLPNAPKRLYVSNHSGRYSTGTEAKLRLADGRFTGYLSDLLIGTAHTEAEGTSTGDLDIATAEVQIGPEANKIFVPGVFKICSGKFAYGRLRIPSAINDISVGTFSLGRGVLSGATGNEPQGILDIGSNSQLRAITATNGFYWSTDNGVAHMGYTDGSGSFVEAFPTGLTLTVGSPDAAVPFHLAGGNVTGNYNWRPYNTGSLVLAKGTLRAWATDLCVGFISDTASGHPHYGFPRGLLDLSDASVAFNGITNSVVADRILVGGHMLPDQSGGQGKLILPASITNFSAGHIQIGCGGSYVPGGSEGYLDFGTGSQLRTFSVARDLWMGAQNGDTGRIVNLPVQNLSFTIGSPVARGGLCLGTHDAYGNGNHLGNADLTLTGATFSAYLTNLFIGTSLSAGTYGGARGRLDLSASTVTVFDVEGPVIIGMGSNSSASSINSGTLVLPPGNVRFKSVTLGNLNTTNTFGLIELRGAVCTVDDQLRILPSGVVTAQVGEVSSGFAILNTNANALAILGSGRLHLAFNSDPAELSSSLWGLRWAGDHLDTLETLVAAGAITWQTSSLSAPSLRRFAIHYDLPTDATFIGIRRPLAFGSLILIR